MFFSKSLSTLFLGITCSDGKSIFILSIGLVFGIKNSYQSILHPLEFVEKDAAYAIYAANAAVLGAKVGFTN